MQMLSAIALVIKLKPIHTKRENSKETKSDKSE